MLEKDLLAALKIHQGMLTAWLQLAAATGSCSSGSGQPPKPRFRAKKHSNKVHQASVTLENALLPCSRLVCLPFDSGLVCRVLSPISVSMTIGSQVRCSNVKLEILAWHQNLRATNAQIEPPTSLLRGTCDPPTSAVSMLSSL